MSSSLLLLAKKLLLRALMWGSGGPMTSSTIELRSTWLLAWTMGSTRRLVSAGGGHTSSWKMEPVPEPRARRRIGGEGEWVLRIMLKLAMSGGVDGDGGVSGRGRVAIDLDETGRWWAPRW